MLGNFPRLAESTRMLTSELKPVRSGTPTSNQTICIHIMECYRTSLEQEDNLDVFSMYTYEI